MSEQLKYSADKTSIQVAMDLLSFAAKYTTYSEINHNVREYFKDVDALTLSIIYDDLLDLGVDNEDIIYSMRTLISFIASLDYTKTSLVYVKEHGIKWDIYALGALLSSLGYSYKAFSYTTDEYAKATVRQETAAKMAEAINRQIKYDFYKLSVKLNSIQMRFGNDDHNHPMLFMFATYTVSYNDITLVVARPNENTFEYTFGSAGQSVTIDLPDTMSAATKAIEHFFASVFDVEDYY
jgi:hypothetical protein